MSFSHKFLDLWKTFFLCVDVVEPTSNGGGLWRRRRLTCTAPIFFFSSQFGTHLLSLFQFHAKYANSSSSLLQWDHESKYHLTLCECHALSANFVVYLTIYCPFFNHPRLFLYLIWDDMGNNRSRISSLLNTTKIPSICSLASTVQIFGITRITRPSFLELLLSVFASSCIYHTNKLIWKNYDKWPYFNGSN